MANAMFPFVSFNFNENQDHLSRMEDEIDSFCSDQYGFYQENMAIKGPHDQQQQPTLDYCMLGASDFNTTVSTKKHEHSLELISNYASGFKKLKGAKLSNITGGHEETEPRSLSTEEIMRVAGERYIQFSTQTQRVLDMALMHPFGSSLSCLSFEETQDVELAHLLLAAAEKVSYQQFQRASSLLARCEWLASDTGSPVKRIVFYFAQALRQRIDRETGQSFTKGMYNNIVASLALSSNLAFLICHQELPFTQVTQFAGIQAVLENVALESRVHLIDFNIRSGVQWTVLMQALADHQQRAYPIEHLKITAVGTTEREKIEETGKRLVSSAESLNLPFSFKIVFLSDMKDLKEELFDIEPDEAMVVYSSTILRSMISSPDSLETLMRVIRRLNPSIMVITEVEANHNSPSFVNRFIEALFFYSAFFDCLEDCMERENQYRMVLEGMFFRDGIHNIVATEGKERITRSVKIDVWRAFFERFGMVEIELSDSSLYQANSVVQHFSCGSSCTLENNGKCLIVGWKGTPVHSLSAWKFL